MDQIIDQSIPSLIVELRGHMSNTFERHQFKVTAQCPYFPAVLSAIFGGGVPGAPVLLGGQSEFFSDFVDPGDGAGVGDCGVGVSGVNHDLVFVEGDQFLVHPVGACGASLVIEVVVCVAHGEVYDFFGDVHGFAVVFVVEDAISAVGVNAGRGPCQRLSFLSSDSEGVPSHLPHGHFLAIQVIIFVARFEDVVDIDAIE